MLIQSHSDRCEPLTDRKAQTTHRSLRVGVCGMTEILAELCGMQTQQGARFLDLLVAQAR